MIADLLFYLPVRKSRLRRHFQQGILFHPMQNCFYGDSSVLNVLP
jgi:hypothetical protein